MQHQHQQHQHQLHQQQQLDTNQAGPVVQQEHQAMQHSQMLAGYSHYQAAAVHYHPAGVIAAGPDARSSLVGEHQYSPAVAQHQGNLIVGADFNYANQHYQHQQHSQFFDYTQLENGASYHQQPVNDISSQLHQNQQQIIAEQQLYAAGQYSQQAGDQFALNYPTDAQGQQSAAYLQQHRQVLGAVVGAPHPDQTDQGRSTDANEFR